MAIQSDAWWRFVGLSKQVKSWQWLMTGKNHGATPPRLFSRVGNEWVIHKWWTSGLTSGLASGLQPIKVGRAITNVFNYRDIPVIVDCKRLEWPCRLYKKLRFHHSSWGSMHTWTGSGCTCTTWPINALSERCVERLLLSLLSIHLIYWGIHGVSIHGVLEA